MIIGSGASFKRKMMNLVSRLSEISPKLTAEEGRANVNFVPGIQ
jgi:hypothetical protein